MTPSIPLPDLLWKQPCRDADDDLLAEVLDLAFLGRDPGRDLDRALDGRQVEASTWNPEFFSTDLFVRDFIDSCLVVEHHDRSFPIQRAFIERVLNTPPKDSDTIRFRQDILRELAENPSIREHTEDVHRALHHLLSLFRAARSDTRLNHAAFRLEILRQAKAVVDLMTCEFHRASSGLRRLHFVGQEIEASDTWQLLQSILDYEENSSRLLVEVRLGADGRIRDLDLLGLNENKDNRFHRRPWKRWLDIGRLFWHRARLDPQVVIDGIIFQVYLKVAPAVRSLLQILGHLDVYLAFCGFAARVQSRGLDVCLAEVGDHAHLDLHKVFNPLLLNIMERPRPCDISPGRDTRITLVTGPNSGGKTRVLQAIGLSQLLGQSGFYVPCRSATMPIVDGLFVSLTESGHADQLEGRLGTELLRIKKLFAVAPQRSMVLLDELCSGTNPSEATEIVSMVLELLDRLDPVAYITTHFLDYAKHLEQHQSRRSLAFLQVAIDEEQNSTFTFVPGVAATSLASTTAHRLGVTFEELADRIGAPPKETVTALAGCRS